MKENNLDPDKLEIAMQRVKFVAESKMSMLQLISPSIIKLLPVAL